MASITIRINKQDYTDGVELGAYPKDRFNPTKWPDAAPPGNPVDTDVIVDSRVTFDLPRGEYYVTSTSPPYRYVSIVLAVIPEPDMLLDDLADVEIYDASDGDVLTYNLAAGQWRASPVPPIPGELGDLSNMNVGLANPRDILVFDGQDWNASEPGHLNVKDFGAKGDGVTDDTLAIQAAVDAVRVAGASGGAELIVPAGTYLLSDTIILNSPDADGAVKMRGAAAWGSSLRHKPVMFTRVSSGTTHTLFKGFGHGVELSNMSFYGKDSDGILLDIERGFELKLWNCHFFRTRNHGARLRSLSNSLIRDCHFFLCGDDETAAVRIAGKGADTGEPTAEYISNTTTIDNVHFERNPGVDLDIGTGPDPSDQAEFVQVHALHIEGNYHNIPSSYEGRFPKTTPHLRIGSVRGFHMTNSFIVGGKGPLISVEKDHDTGVNVMDGTSITNSYFLGYLTDGVVDPDYTPDVLVDLVSGNNFHMTGCTLDRAIQNLVRIDENFGAEVTIEPNHWKTVSGGVEIAGFVDDDRAVKNPIRTRRNLQVGTGSFENPTLFIDGAAESVRRISFRTGNLDRWFIQASQDAETGGEAGSTLQVVRRNDDGSHGGYVVEFDRANGQGSWSAPQSLPVAWLREQSSTPGNDPAGKGAVLFSRDNAGKTELCVKFATGAVQVLATQP